MENIKLFSIFKNKKQLLEQIRIVSESEYFDRQWYLNTYPDVAVSGIDPAKHYLKHGWIEGRNPGPKFDTLNYLNKHPSVSECPLINCERLNNNQNKQTKLLEISNYELIRQSGLFDAKYYLKHYPEIKKLDMDPIQHFMCYGWKEKKNPSNNFDTSFYLKEYIDVSEANINPLIHYLRYGQFENRKAKMSLWEMFVKFFHFNNAKMRSDYLIIKKSKYFNKRYYIKQCQNFDKTNTDPIKHYLSIGWKEGLNPSKKFDTNYYLEVNADVKNAGINPLLHYEKHGKYEHRNISPSIDNEIISDMKKYLDAKNCDILLFSHELSITGAPLVLFNIAKILKTRNHKPIIISPNHGSLEKSLKSEEIEYYVCAGIDNINISELKTCFSKFDLAICNTYLLTGLALRLQNILPTLLYIHEGPEGLFDLNSEQTRIISGTKITKLLPQIENIVCVSPYAKSFYTPYVNHKIEILQNYVDEISIHPKYSQKKVKFCYVGTITKIRKNVDILLKCYQNLYENNINAELHIIGNINTTEAQNFIKDYPNVKWHGTLTGLKKQKVMNNCDVVIIPSSTESCSLVALEAASLSKPVIITNTVGAKYMFKNKETALFCNPNNEKSLTECMLEMVNNKHLIRKMGEKAYKAYKKYATKEVFERKLFNIIKNVKYNFGKTKHINDLTIIVPIYNAAEKTDKCIKSIIHNTQLSKQVQLLLIDDCSPEPEVEKVLNKYKNTNFINVVRNAENLGYTKNINKAIIIAQKRDVILLNSDTVVTKNWIKKLQKVAYLSLSIGTVTPVSNSAGAFSVPKSGSNVISAPLTIEKVGKIVSEVGQGKFFDAPTGNGFCFFIKRSAIDTIGLFDEENFPKGYGEENDFSMRVKQNGFLNIVTLDTYIFHHEHASFKESSKLLMEKGINIINTLYPSYSSDIKVFTTNPTFNDVKLCINKKIGDRKKCL